MIGKLIRAHRRTALAYQATIDSLLSAIEMRDIGTGTHSERVVSLALHLAQEVGLPEGKMEALGQAALLHDRQDRCTRRNPAQANRTHSKESVQMRYHVERGYKLLHSVVNLKAAATIVLRHHERWDGSGYPRGMKGKAIPLEARIFAVVDVWDALISPRPYRKAWSE